MPTKNLGSTLDLISKNLGISVNELSSSDGGKQKSFGANGSDENLGDDTDGREDGDPDDDETGADLDGDLDESEEGDNDNDPDDEADPDDEEVDEPPRRKVEDKARKQPDTNRGFKRQGPIIPGSMARLGFRINKAGDIYNKEGRLVAMHGREARYFMDRHTAQRESGKLRGDLQQTVGIATRLGNELKALREQANYGAKLNLSEKDQRDALDLAALFVKDPKAAVRSILTRAAAGGIDLKDVGFNGSEALAEIVKTIRAELDPIRQTTTKEQERQKAEAAEKRQRETIAREVTDFFERNPDAEPYMGAIQQVLEQPQFSHMTLGEVWAKIQLHLERSRRSQNGRSNKDRRNAKGTKNAGPSRPSGRSFGSRNGKRERPLNVGASLDDIANAALDEAGWK